MILNCAPATGRAAPSGSETIALSDTVSPGLAVTLSRTHAISPSNLGALTMIAPSVRVTLSVTSSPFVSVINALSHVTGYVPSAVSFGTV